MYNADLKNKFLEEGVDSQRTASNFKYAFERVAKFEEAWGYDICNAQPQDIQQVIDEVYKGRTLTQESFLSYIRRYTKWCVDNNVSTSSPPSLTGEIEFSPPESCRETFVSSPLHLKKFLDEILTFSEEQNSVENIYRCLYWLAFSGIKRSDVMSVKKADVDLHHMAIRFGEYKQEFPIYRESLDMIVFAVKARSFYYYHPKYNNVIIRDRIDSEFLISGMKKLDLRQVLAEMSRKNGAAVSEGKTSQRLSYERIRLSGMFYRIREMEQAGYDIDFIQIVEEEISEEGDSKKVSRKNIMDKARDMRRDYDRWKIAYNY